MNKKLNSTQVVTPQAPLTLTFPVKSFRRFPDPYKNGEKSVPAVYFASCDVKDLPDNIPMGTNPREQNMNTNVAKKIKASLLGGINNFYLLNRGILLSAESVAYNSYTGNVTVVFSDLDVHGNVDGGHTYRIILENRDQLERGQQYVTLELLTGVNDIFEDLAAARNTSVQVQDKSIAELENRFKIIKDALNGCIDEKEICFKENAEGSIDVGDILAILMMFNIDQFPDSYTAPIVAYNSKKKCIDTYIQEHKKHDNAETVDNPYFKMRRIMPDIFKLYDKIERNMEQYYRAINQGGKYKLVKGVVCPPEGKKFKSKFLKKELDVQSPNGFIYPILGAFRALVEEGSDGYYQWKLNPFEILDETGPGLVWSTVSLSRNLGNNPISTGKSRMLWESLYSSVDNAALRRIIAKS